VLDGVPGEELVQEVGAVVEAFSEFLALGGLAETGVVPPGSRSEAEDHAAIGEVLKRAGLKGHLRRSAARQRHDHWADEDPAGCLRDRGKRDPRIRKRWS
jgi:hypothetical protein